MEQQEIKVLLTRLGRPSESGEVVIERAALLSVGAEAQAVIDWILANGGVAEEAVVSVRNRGLHGTRITGSGSTPARQPQRYLLPVGALAD